EHMARTDAWRFHDMGRRVERAMSTIRFVRAFGGPEATSDDLSTLLDLLDSQISYRQRYLTGIARLPVIDLVTLDPGNPRGVAFQVMAIHEHLSRLPVLSDDGLAEPQQEQARELAAQLATTRADRIHDSMLAGIETRLARLSDAVARRYFLHGAEPLRAAGLVLA
ncbi:MAG TPA: alpha-E domain-containing protein, partial [Sphingomonas sp.]|nr:alpha-E domain-containing protein [Sphingomonas sp.]